MRKYASVVIAITLPAFGQLHRGNAGSMFSGLHNHWAFPIDGGQVMAFELYNPGNTDCITYHPPNVSSFTGSPAATLTCGGTTAPTISSTGVVIGTHGYVAFSSGTFNLPNGYTFSSAFNATSNAGSEACGFVNSNAITNNTYQYFGPGVGGNSIAGNIYFLYETPTVEAFVSTQTPISSATWATAVVGYTSGSGTSTQLWANNLVLSGTWVAGNGNVAVPASQSDTRIGGVKTSGDPANPCVGTIGYTVAHDHNINSSAERFIHAGFYRAMQFRGVALP